jgi:colanic acid/amylovoran biosynthesis glycosyltransferase
MSGLGVAYLPVLALLRSARVVVSCRGTAEKIKPLTDEGRASDLGKLFQLADRVHCVSQNMLDSCKKYGLSEHKAFVNRPAIRIDAFTRDTSVSEARHPLVPIRVCSIGRLHWNKGFDFALLAMKLLKDSGERVVLEIIGDGPEREKLVYLTEALGLADSVTLAGRLDSMEVKARLESCDIFLLPSLSEGISNAALEAMAMELPVISTRSGGMDELISDGQNGLLLDCYAPDQIANSIRRLARDAELQRDLGKNARQTILDEFSIERQLSCFVLEYQNQASSSVRHPRRIASAL